MRLAGRLGALERREISKSAMLLVNRWFLSNTGKYFMEEDARVGVNIYAGADRNAAVVGVLRESQPWSVFILATVGDNWYHILCGDGLTGYVETRHFWDGNG